MKVDMEKVTFSYSRDAFVLKDIDLILDEPGLTCIIGPNGVGKSTLVKCINKLLIPTSGSIFLDETDVKSLNFKMLSKKIGFVPATTSDSFSMSVIDTVLMGRTPHKHLGSENEDLHIVYNILEDMNLTHLALRNNNELSAGQHQRVSIARGLAQEPDLLILDEPTANLDIRHQVMVIELLKKVAHENKITVLMISHDLNITAKYADKVIVMSTPGVIHSVGTPREVMNEDMIRYVYGMNSKILDMDGHLHIILGSAVSDDEMILLHRNECDYGN